jgi:hypothetical protein
VFPSLQRTNNKPYETITYKDDILFLFDECNDSPSSSSPTCGWFYNTDGTVVRDSQVNLASQASLA